jgi:hypothetical protein
MYNPTDQNQLIIKYISLQRDSANNALAMANARLESALLEVEALKNKLKEKDNQSSEGTG